MRRKPGPAVNPGLRLHLEFGVVAFLDRQLEDPQLDILEADRLSEHEKTIASADLRRDHDRFAAQRPGDVVGIKDCRTPFLRDVDFVDAKIVTRKIDA